jgi:hypothetical protein
VGCEGVGEVESLLGEDGVRSAGVSILQSPQDESLPAVLWTSSGQGLEDLDLPLALLSLSDIAVLDHALTIPQV